MDDTKLAYHFQQEGHTSKDMGVVVIEEVKGKDDMTESQGKGFGSTALGLTMKRTKGNEEA